MTTATTNTRKARFTSMVKESTVSGKELDSRTFSKHQRQYAGYKLKVLSEFCVFDHEGTILAALMNCTSYVQMDRVAREFISKRLATAHI